jgi:hypothetical protein
MKSRYRSNPPQSPTATSPAVAPANNSALGVPCRDCGARIVFTMDQILSGTEITCQCGLTISVVPERSAETLRDLHELKRRLSQE